jgi:hypothetical protein
LAKVNALKDVKFQISNFKYEIAEEKCNQVDMKTGKIVILLYFLYKLCSRSFILHQKKNPKNPATVNFSKNSPENRSLGPKQYNLTKPL